jgi:hypothetical protein
MTLHAVLVMLFQLQATDTGFVAALQRAVASEPIEVFGRDTGHVSISGVTLLDIDGDGKPEAFVWIVPAFRQTPTVLVYHATAQGVVRLTEGLAPGRLQLIDPGATSPRDSHWLGYGLDVGANSGQTFLDSARVSKVISIALNRSLSIVVYRTFFHADFRRGFRGYLDMSDRSLPGAPVDTVTCTLIWFSRVDGLAAGSLAGDDARQYLVALTSDDITIYRFDGLRTDGLFRKHTWTRPRPPNVTGVRADARGQVQLVARDGSSTAIGAP